MSDPYLNPHRSPEDPIEHVWASPDCPDCECCSSRLCYQAGQRKVSCATLSPPQPGQHDTSKCPCAPSPWAVTR